MPLCKNSSPGAVVVREVSWPSDAEAVFLRLASRPGCVWLDSAGGPPHLARWSVLTADPGAVLSHEGGVTELRAAGGRVLLAERGSPMETLRRTLAGPSTANCRGARRASGGPGCPAPPQMLPAGVPFGPGLYGYLSYDLAPYIEPKAALSERRDIALPDLWFGVYEAALVLDHRERRAYLVGAPGRAWDALASSASTSPRRKAGVAVAPAPGGASTPGSRRGLVMPRCSSLSCNLSRDEFLRAVARAREYIAAGDIFQVNLSRRYTAPLAAAAGASADSRAAGLYLRLRRANPAPYAAYLGLGEGRAVLSSSPELFLSLDGGHVVTRPIKGTRPHRPGDEAFNARMRADLLAAEKDRAELVMIVDLERNDLGRVSTYGSVRVTAPRDLETYAAVYHTVATVEGCLHAGHDVVDLLKATFPGGSITGAPKIRAMQIIAELEPTRRSLYTGAVGYLAPQRPSDPAGRCALNIAIRTLLVAEGRVHLQVGGGIVADSQPEAEFDETEDKARALLAALNAPSP